MAAWHKSTYSANASACVEVATGVGIRDSKAPAAHVQVGVNGWACFLLSVKRHRRCHRTDV
ncbi:DUF397 domain-containing protein [Lentzea sp. CC55]|uniref:DUF397 domain-containing protein n=1 Tax=Lentzea sp. CC55 TaxID=2884909 RepID=UPI001F38201E|nr:DUF397 domain-containing protein [Lentzea sp. CC55]MCG8928177.1 DUF397 domain-containing protein [Lentzea sp. CC55]